MRRRIFGLGLAAIGLALAAPAIAQSYDRHVVFDNARVPGPYHFSLASRTGQSLLDYADARIPVDTGHFHSPPNSLRLTWTSLYGGDWRVSIDVQHYFRTNDFEGHRLTLWVYAEEEIGPDASPGLILTDKKGNSTPTIRLLGDVKTLLAHKWVPVHIALDDIRDMVNSTQDSAVDLRRLASVTIVQGLDDGRPHTLYLDDIRIDDPSSAPHGPARAPGNLAAKGYDRHVDLSWQVDPEPGVESYRIYRSIGGEPFEAIAIQKGHIGRYEDFLGASGTSATYRISALDGEGRESPLSPTVSAATRALDDDELLTMVQEAQFRYYWEGAQPDSGMAIEVMPGDPNQVAVGASGFGMMAMLVGIDRGFVTR